MVKGLTRLGVVAGVSYVPTEPHVRSNLALRVVFFKLKGLNAETVQAAGSSSNYRLEGVVNCISDARGPFSGSLSTLVPCPAFHLLLSSSVATI